MPSRSDIPEAVPHPTLHQHEPSDYAATSLICVNAPILRDSGGTRVYFSQDANFNVTGVFNSSGNITQRMVYDSGGNVSFKTSAWGNGSNSQNVATLFQGMRYDSAIGWYFVGNTNSGRLYSPTMEVWNRPDPLGYVDGLDDYAFVADNPINYRDPAGLATVGDQGWTGGMVRPSTDAGSGTWGKGIDKVSYEWSVRDTSEMADLHRKIGSAGPGVFALIKVKKGNTCPFTSFQWIEYTKATQNGRPYVGPNGNAWDGIDVGGRDDGLPYSDAPPDQRRINQGTGAGWEGDVRGLYDPTGTDSVFIDWAYCGGLRNYKQTSVVALIGQRERKDYLLGALKFWYYTDRDGKMASFGGSSVVTAAEMGAWLAAIRAQEQYANYLKDVYAGPAQ